MLCNRGCCIHRGFFTFSFFFLFFFFFYIQPEQLREANSQNKDLTRQVQELSTIRIQLEGERDGLANELADTRDAFKDAQARLDGATAALNALRNEMENRLREKDDEIENVR